MLKIKSVTTVTIATEEKATANYELSYAVTDGVLGSAKCDIVSKTMVEVNTPEGDIEVPQLEKVGDIRIENGRMILSDFDSHLPVAEYLTVFNELVKEITPKTVEVKTK